MPFNDAERAYLHSQPMGRLATLGPDGTIDLGGPWVARTQRWRNVQAHPKVSFVVDDMTPDGPEAIKPGMGRGVEIRGRAETLAVDDPPGAPGMSAPEVIRIHPARILSWHIDPAMPDGRSVDHG